jgi:hypothetical protein
MNMDGINKARRIDGHTTPVTDEESEDFSNSSLDAFEDEACPRESSELIVGRLHTPYKTRIV